MALIRLVLQPPALEPAFPSRFDDSLFIHCITPNGSAFFIHILYKIDVKFTIDIIITFSMQFICAFCIQLVFYTQVTKNLFAYTVTVGTEAGVTFNTALNPNLGFGIVYATLSSTAFRTTNIRETSEYQCYTLYTIIFVVL